MHNLFLTVAIVALSSGIVLRVVSRRHPTELGQSLVWYNPNNWFWQPKKNVRYFTRLGLRLHRISSALLLCGAVIYLVELSL